MIGAGAFVAFGDGHEGLLPVRRLRGDWWELNELETMLVGSRSERALRLGDPVDGAGRARRRAARARRPVARRVVAMAKGDQAQGGTRATSRRTGRRRFRYHLLDRFEAGMVLTGTEVKALRDGKAQIKDGYAAPQATASCGCTTSTSRPTRPPRATTTSPSARASCCCTATSSTGWRARTKERGLTLVPTRLYFSTGARAKVEIALARGKDVGDKRQTIKEREIKREMDRAINAARRR